MSGPFGHSTHSILPTYAPNHAHSPSHPLPQATQLQELEPAPCHTIKTMLCRSTRRTSCNSHRTSSFYPPSSFHPHAQHQLCEHTAAAATPLSCAGPRTCLGAPRAASLPDLSHPSVRSPSGPPADSEIAPPPSPYSSPPCP